MTKRDQGADHDPAIAAALFCENVLVERDGTHSFIRIVDSVSLIADASVDLSKEQTLTHPLALAVALRSREASGTIRITIRHTPPPNGTKLEGLPQAAELEIAPGRLTVATVHLTGGQVAAGRHMFEIRVVGGAVTAMPFDVHFNHASELAPPRPQDTPPD